MERTPPLTHTLNGPFCWCHSCDSMFTAYSALLGWPTVPTFWHAVPQCLVCSTATSGMQYRNVWHAVPRCSMSQCSRSRLTAIVCSSLKYVPTPHLPLLLPPLPLLFPLPLLLPPLPLIPLSPSPPTSFLPLHLSPLPLSLSSLSPPTPSPPLPLSLPLLPSLPLLSPPLSSSLSLFSLPPLPLYPPLYSL